VFSKVIMQLKAHGSVIRHSGGKLRYNGKDVLNLRPRKFLFVFR